MRHIFLQIAALSVVLATNSSLSAQLESRFNFSYDTNIVTDPPPEITQTHEQVDGLMVTDIEVVLTITSPSTPGAAGGTP